VLRFTFAPPSCSCPLPTRPACLLRSTQHARTPSPPPPPPSSFLATWLRAQSSDSLRCAGCHSPPAPGYWLLRACAPAARATTSAIPVSHIALPSSCIIGTPAARFLRCYAGCTWDVLTSSCITPCFAPVGVGDVSRWACVHACAARQWVAQLGYGPAPEFFVAHHIAADFACMKHAPLCGCTATTRK
jgi:hypothetical protein